MLAVGGVGPGRSAHRVMGGTVSLGVAAAASVLGTSRLSQQVCLLMPFHECLFFLKFNKQPHNSEPAIALMSR